jgi:M6 family metalloprotease-like protein
MMGSNRWKSSAKIALVLLIVSMLEVTAISQHGTDVTAHFAPSLLTPTSGQEPILASPPILRAPVAGVLRVLAIAVTFSNVNSSLSIKDLQKAFFVQVNEYYKEISYAAVSLQGDVFGWYRLDRPQEYYGRDCQNVDDSDCGGQPMSWHLAEDAVQAAERDVNFDNYDYFMFVHSGAGQETSADKNAVWSVAYLGGIWIRTKERSIGKFAIVPETEAKGAAVTGVYTHELGHLLGLPDLYDSTTGRPRVGVWSLMDKGLWNGDPPGSSPAHMEAWSMIKLSWISVDLLANVRDGTLANLTLQAIEVSSRELHAIMIPVSQASPPTQYYLVEVRQRIGFDQALPSAGVLITYVDERFGAKLTVMDGHPKIPGLTDATWKTGQIFIDEKNSLAIAILGQIGTAYQITVNRLGPMPDLAITKAYTQPQEIKPDTAVTLFIDIANQGTQTASDVPVQILLDGQTFSGKQVTVPAGQTIEISLSWNSVAGSHIFLVTIDPNDILKEFSKSNNQLSIRVNVGPTIIITVPLNVTASSGGAWIRVNGELHQASNQTQMRTTVLAGTVTVEIQPAVDSSTGVRELFVKWSDGNAQNPRQLTVTSDTTLTAIYNTQYLLTVNQNGGTTSPSGWYDAYTVVQVTATSPSNVIDKTSRLVFTNWSGDYNSESTSTTLTMTRPFAVSANWRTQYYVNIISAAGSVTGAGWYDVGTQATISVQSPVQVSANQRQIFAGWSGGVIGHESMVKVTVNSPITIQAQWTMQYLVVVQSPYGDPRGAGWYDAKTTARVSVLAEIDYINRTRIIFLQWNGDYIWNNATATLTVDGPKTLTAEWITQYDFTFSVTGIPESAGVALLVHGKPYELRSAEPLHIWVNRGEQVNIQNETIPENFATTLRFSGWQDPAGKNVRPPLLVTGPGEYAAVYHRELTPAGLAGIILIACVTIAALLRRHGQKPHRRVKSRSRTLAPEVQEEEITMPLSLSTQPTCDEGTPEERLTYWLRRTS